MLHAKSRLFAVLAATVCLFQSDVDAQEQLGMRLERYAGIYGAALNPSATAFNPNNWELSLVSADLFLNNNYGFLHNTSLQHALRNPDLLISVLDTSAERIPPKDAISQDFFDRNRKMFAVVQTRISGPSLSFRLGADNVIGIVTGVRAGFSTYGLPGILRYRNISDLPRNQVINLPSARLAGMAWREIGLHYSRRFESGDYVMAVGITPRYLSGYEGFFLRANTAFDYTQRYGDTVAFAQARWEYGVTTDNLSDQSNQVKRRINGRGFGVDLGFSIAQPDGENPADYAWRLGVSLIDIGKVNFNKSAQRHLIEFDSTIAVSPANFPPRNNATDLFSDASKAFLGDPAASLSATQFGIGLPTAASLQFDAHIDGGFYVSALLVQRVPLLRNSLRRPNTFALVPRFEQRWFSASIPVVISDWQFVRVGLAARLGWLYLGTDNLNSFMRSPKLTGTDFYIGLKINAFNLGFGKLNVKLPHRKPHGHTPSQFERRKIKCYQF